MLSPSHMTVSPVISSSGLMVVIVMESVSEQFPFETMSQYVEVAVGVTRIPYAV